MFPDLLNQTVHHGPSNVAMRHLPPAESNGGLHLAAFLQKSENVVLLHLEVMPADARPELDFFKLDRALMLARVVLALALLVEILAVIDNPAHGRVGARRNFH